MSLSATLFGRDSLIFKATNILGLGIPGLLHDAFGPAEPGAQPGQALGELAQQTAKEGGPRTIVWGRVRPIGGNLIHCQAPVKRWVVTEVEGGGGGKGGGGKKKKQEQRTEHVYRTYAIGVCEGPITAFSRIWRNNKLVYDGRGTAWGARNNGVFLRSFRLYLGAWSQMPDPTLQSIWGAGSVPAYRGTAYMVAIDEDLTELGGSVPQWLFEVERAEGIIVTSKLYAVTAADAIAPGISFGTAIMRSLVRSAKISPDALGPSISFGTADLREPIAREEFEDSMSPSILFGEAVLREPTKRTGFQDSIQPGVQFETASLRTALIVQPMVPDAIDPGITFGEAQLYEAD